MFKLNVYSGQAYIDLLLLLLLFLFPAILSRARKYDFIRRLSISFSLVIRLRKYSARMTLVKIGLFFSPFFNQNRSLWRWCCICPCTFPVETRDTKSCVSRACKYSQVLQVYKILCTCAFMGDGHANYSEQANETLRKLLLKKESFSSFPSAYLSLAFFGLNSPGRTQYLYTVHSCL